MSSRSLNKVMLIGNLTRDVDVRYTPSGTAVATFGLATNRSWSAGEGGDRQEETQFHRIVAWSKLAEICGQLLFKGRRIYVEGRLQTRKFTGQDGQQREVTEIVAENMMILDTRNRDGNGGGSYSEDEFVGTDEQTSVASDMGQAPASSSDDAAPKKTTKKVAKTEEKTETSLSDEVNVEDIPF
ncbi:MAG: single-stranded DNA-binding protein [Candidatus Moraniibacteriota bacterium]|nr:MAG: single-stranded DNA-binding protein [Candidatus Moranbacteria bacterium]